MGVVVVDLDGTLANCDHRLPLIRETPKRWDEFHLACDKDAPNKWCVNLICAMLEMGHQVKIVTARSDIALVKTVAWLDKHVPGVELAMIRKVRDHRNDDVLKQAWLEDQDKREILFVVEDRQRVVDMWRRNGLVCLQAYAWEEMEKEKYPIYWTCTICDCPPIPESEWGAHVLSSEHSEATKK